MLPKGVAHVDQMCLTVTIVYKTRLTPFGKETYIVTHKNCILKMEFCKVDLSICVLG